MQDTKKRLEVLRNLAQLDVDAMGTYEAAMVRCAEVVRAKLSEFRVDHARHVQDLNALMVKLGGAPVEQEPDIKGRFLKAATAATSALGTEGALIAMVGNEELTNRSYDAALLLDWTEEERALLDKNRSDERRHLEWVKRAVVERPWAHGESAHP